MGQHRYRDRPYRRRRQSFSGAPRAPRNVHAPSTIRLRPPKKSEKPSGWTARAGKADSFWAAAIIGVAIDLPSVWFLAALKYLIDAKFSVAVVFLLLLSYALIAYISVELSLLFSIKWPTQTRARGPVRRQLVQGAPANNCRRDSGRHRDLATLARDFQAPIARRHLEIGGFVPRVASGRHHHILGRVQDGVRFSSHESDGVRRPAGQRIRFVPSQQGQRRQRNAVASSTRSMIARSSLAPNSDTVDR